MLFINKRTIIILLIFLLGDKNAMISRSFRMCKNHTRKKNNSFPCPSFSIGTRCSHTLSLSFFLNNIRFIIRIRSISARAIMRPQNSFPFMCADRAESTIDLRISFHFCSYLLFFWLIFGLHWMKLNLELVEWSVTMSVRACARVETETSVFCRVWRRESIHTFSHFCLLWSFSSVDYF